jgi:hypothetical protein
MIGMGIPGATNEYPTINFRRIGEGGIKIDGGRDSKKPGVFGVISLNHNRRCRNKGVKGNRNINRNQRFSSISSRDSSNSRGNLRFTNHNTLSPKGNLKEGR